MVWTYIWLGIVVASLIVEFVTMELVSVWISFGAFVAMILSLINGVGYIAQIIVALAISILCILFLRKIALKFLNRNQDKTNLDIAIGEKVKLIDGIETDKLGSAKYNGIVWSVKTENGEQVKANKFVEIVKIEGNKLIVKPIKTEVKEVKKTKQTDNK